MFTTITTQQTEEHKVGKWLHWMRKQRADEYKKKNEIKKACKCDLNDRHGFYEIFQVFMQVEFDNELRKCR